LPLPLPQPAPAKLRAFLLELTPSRKRKINLKKWRIFRHPKNDVQTTTFTTQNTTTSPAKHHVKNTLFLKPPSKMPAKPRKKAPATAGAFFSKPKPKR